MGPIVPAHGVARGRYPAGGAAARRERRDPRGLHRGAGSLRRRHAGRRLAPDGPMLQPGAQLDATWRARLSEHIGSFRVEPVRSRAADAMDDRLALAGLRAVCALLSFCLPERAPYPALYARSLALLDGLGAERWAEAYLGWEVALLSEMGLRPQPRALRGDGVVAGPRLRFAAHGSRRLARRGGRVCRPPPAVSALPRRDAGRECSGPRRRAADDGAFPAEPPRAVARRQVPAACAPAARRPAVPRCSDRRKRVGSGRAVGCAVPERGAVRRDLGRREARDRDGHSRVPASVAGRSKRQERVGRACRHMPSRSPRGRAVAARGAFRTARAGSSRAGRGARRPGRGWSGRAPPRSP
jgi:hypothetical protein